MFRRLIASTATLKVKDVPSLSATPLERALQSRQLMPFTVKDLPQLVKESTDEPVYAGVMSSNIRRLKRFSLATAVLTISAAPVMALASQATTATQFYVATGMASVSLTTTLFFMQVTSSYIVRMYYKPAKPTGELHEQDQLCIVTFDRLSREKTHEICLRELCPSPRALAQWVVRPREGSFLQQLPKIPVSQWFSRWRQWRQSKPVYFWCDIGAVQTKTSQLDDVLRAQTDLWYTLGQELKLKPSDAAIRNNIQQEINENYSKELDWVSEWSKVRLVSDLVEWVNRNYEKKMTKQEMTPRIVK